MIEEVKRKAGMFVGDLIFRQTDISLNKEDGMVICFPGEEIEAIKERMETIMDPGKGRSILVHTGTNNAKRVQLP